MLDGDESDVGAASIALGGKLLEAMISDTAGPRALGAAEQRAVDSEAGPNFLFMNRNGELMNL